MNDLYSIVIQWSDKDNCFVATLPEWENRHAQGQSYEQALEKCSRSFASFSRVIKIPGRIPT